MPTQTLDAENRHSAAHGVHMTHPAAAAGAVASKQHPLHSWRMTHKPHLLTPPPATHVPHSGAAPAHSRRCGRQQLRQRCCPWPRRLCCCCCCQLMWRRHPAWLCGRHGKPGPGRRVSGCTQAQGGGAGGGSEHVCLCVCIPPGVCGCWYGSHTVSAGTGSPGGMNHDQQLLLASCTRTSAALFLAACRHGGAGGVVTAPAAYGGVLLRYQGHGSWPCMLDEKRSCCPTRQLHPHQLLLPQGV